jgi:hypothetical protein
MQRFFDTRSDWSFFYLFINELFLVIVVQDTSGLARELTCRQSVRAILVCIIVYIVRNMEIICSLHCTELLLLSLNHVAGYTHVYAC